jgi:hypothetical protein
VALYQQQPLNCGEFPLYTGENPEPAVLEASIVQAVTVCVLGTLGCSLVETYFRALQSESNQSGSHKKQKGRMAEATRPSCVWGLGKVDFV